MKIVEYEGDNIKPVIWPPIYPFTYTTKLIGSVEDIDYDGMQTYYDKVDSNIWPPIYPFTYTTKLIGLIKDISYNSLLLYYEAPERNARIWPDLSRGHPQYKLGNPSDYNPIYEISLTNNIKGQTYIVSGPCGAFDDLLMNTLWSMENNLYCNFEDLYKDQPWGYSINLNGAIHQSDISIYKRFDFAHINHKNYNPNYLGMICTEIYPDFEIIDTKFKNTKIIIISVDEDDIMEVISNKLHRMLKYGTITPFHKMMLKGICNKLYNVSIDTFEILEKGAMDLWIKETYAIIINKNFFKSFVNPIIPDKFKDMVLTIKYKDFYTKTEDSYLSIEKLKNFTSAPLTQDVYEQYDNIVCNRKILIESRVP